MDFDQQQLRGIHAVHAGSCELAVADGTTQVLRGGDVVVLPRGDPHVLRSLPADCAEDVAACAILCGAFVVRDTEHPVLGALPHVISIPRGEQPAVGPLVDALGTADRLSRATGRTELGRVAALCIQIG